MKWMLTIFLSLYLVALPSLSIAEVNLSGMTYEELVTLKDQINLAMWKSEEWQEVDVPQGVYKVGVDIPFGHWTITAKDNVLAAVYWGTKLSEGKQGVDWMSLLFSDVVCGKDFPGYTDGSYRTQINLELEDGQYISIESGDVVFSPYTGKAPLNFKR